MITIRLKLLDEGLPAPRYQHEGDAGFDLSSRLDFVLGPGDSLHFDSVRPHLYSNNGSMPARGIWFVVGRREQNRAMPDAPGAPEFDAEAPLNSAVDVLRAMDGLSR